MARLFVLYLLLSLLLSVCFAEIRFSEIRSDDRTIIPFDEFGFTHNGFLELNVSRVALSNPDPDLDLSMIGFFLCTRDSWLHVLQQLEDGFVTCALQSALIKPVYTFNKLRKDQDSFSTIFKENDDGQYNLVLANCLSSRNVSMDVKSAMFNIENGGYRDYLSAGESILPRIYFCFSLVYFALTGFWIHVLYKKRLTVFRVHFLMLAVVILKALNILFEAESKWHIMRTGGAQGWNTLFYVFSFLMGITLFTTLVLIGSGWSILKPNLLGKEKKVLMIVILLQVVTNIAQVEIVEMGQYGQDWIFWMQVFSLLDVVSCCAILLPVFWTIMNLCRVARNDGKSAINLKNLTRFRHYNIVLISYVVSTRVVTYALGILTYALGILTAWWQTLWISVVVGELAIMAFFLFTGFIFKPEAHNPYCLIDDEKETTAEP